MRTRESVFFDNLIIVDDDKKNAKHYFKTKGLEKHIIIKEQLQAWGVENLEYSMIASTYRYDKRLRYILFKYISYIEEFYRAIILDNFRTNPKSFEWESELNNKLSNYNYNLDLALEHIDFKTLLHQSKIMPRDIIPLFEFPKTKHLGANIDALIALRNAVMHNKFLLLYRFGVCYINRTGTWKSTGLKANILNLLSFLPNEVAEKCKNEINEARKEKNNENNKWNLPKIVIIDL